MRFSASGALYDVSDSLKGRYRRGSTARPIIGALGIAGAFAFWGRRTLEHRTSVMPRWPIEQRNEFPMALGIGYGVYLAGAGLGKAFIGSRKGIVSYLGPGKTKRVLGGAINAAMWTGAAVTAYNAGVGYIGRSNENIEPAYAVPPVSKLVSGSEDSLSSFDHLGLQGRRYVTDVTSPALIEEVLGEPAAAAPIRVYVGYNSNPVYPMGRTEIALQELERTGAFDRKHLLLVSPTGTGWVDQTMIESAEFLTRGDIATCVVQYGRFPSFLSVQKVALGRQQFRALLWSIRNRIAGMPEDARPKVLVFGESLGAWASSDVVMYQGIEGFDHYGIDKALWVGLPGLAKWSRNGMALGSSDLVPDGTVRVFDEPSEMEALTAAERRALRATIVSHHNDPIAQMSTDTMIQEPEWLATSERGRGIPDDMEWFPMGTFLQVGVDAMNAMVTVPGNFGSFGHDYRADMARCGLYGIQPPCDKGTVEGHHGVTGDTRVGTGRSHCGFKGRGRPGAPGLSGDAPRGRKHGQASGRGRRAVTRPAHQWRPMAEQHRWAGEAGRRSMSRWWWWDRSMGAAGQRQVVVG